jgi:hypothetical protein
VAGMKRPFTSMVQFYLLPLFTNGLVYLCDTNHCK